MEGTCSDSVGLLASRGRLEPSVDLLAPRVLGSGTILATERVV